MSEAIGSARRGGVPAGGVDSGDRTLPDLLERAFRSRSGTALRHRTEYRTWSWSFERLWEYARRSAALLSSRGLRRGDAVLIWGPNGPAWVTLLLGCFLSGVVAVPVDLRSRPEFVRRIGAETDARLVARTRYRADPGLDAPTLYLEETERLLEATPPLDSATMASTGPIRPSDVAEILYTSGTTAEPKGTVLTHGNLVAAARGLLPVVPNYPLTLLSVLPLSHVFEQVVGLLLPLSVGATIVYLESLRPSTIAEALRWQGITTVLAVPRLLRLFRDDLTRALPSPLRGWPDLSSEVGQYLPAGRRWLSWPLRRAAFPDLRFLVSGGAPLDPDLERFWNGLGIPVLQGYGLTESSAAGTMNSQDERRVGSVGRPLEVVDLRISDDREVLLRGPTVTPGYFRSPERTSEAFADGWLRTGDAGALDEDGFLWLRGRQKDVIVTSAGANVYPEDVETVLNRVAGVRDSAVAEWRDHVHAVLLLEPDAPRPETIVDEANRQLGSTQQILGYTVWPERDLPRTTTGKVRKTEVLTQLPSVEAGGRPAVARGSRIAEIAARLAGLTAASPGARLGPDLHLDSISRVELLAAIEQEVGVDLDEAAVTASTTVQELERLAARQERAHRESFPRWVRTRPVAALRTLIQSAVVLPFVRAFVDLEVRGAEHLEGLAEPVVFAANHTSRLDVPTVLLALPPGYRHAVAPAARAEFFEATGGTGRTAREALFQILALAFGAFKIPQYRAFRPSLRYAGELADHGWSVLFFPEGRQSTDGTMGQFREGLGMLVSALQVPVVPVRLRGLFELASGSRILPGRRGRASVAFGPPLRFRDESYREIAERVEAAVRGL